MENLTVKENATTKTETNMLVPGNKIDWKDMEH